MIERNAAASTRGWRDVQAELGLRDLETTFSFELDVADTQVRAAEVDREVRALLVTGRPSEDVSRKHRLQQADADSDQLLPDCAHRRGLDAPLLVRASRDHVRGPR